MAGLFDGGEDGPDIAFNYDVVAFSDKPALACAADYRRTSPAVYRFVRTEEQKGTIERYTGIYGRSLTGLSRILSKIYVRKLFRQPVDVTGSVTPENLSLRDLRFGQAALTGLNEFA
jgi:hypothetical protein